MHVQNFFKLFSNLIINSFIYLCAMLGIEPRTSCDLSMSSTIELQSSDFDFYMHSLSTKQQSRQ